MSTSATSAVEVARTSTRTRPGDEAARLAALHRLRILDTPPEDEFEELVVLAARIFDAPGALITLVDSDRVWFKARLGVRDTQLPRELALCDETIQHDGVFLVEDASADPRFAGNLLVTGDPGIRFYAGAPLVTQDGAVVGSVCVFDPTVRSANAYQQAMLVMLAEQVTRQMELRAGLAADPTPGGPLAPPLPEPVDAETVAYLRRLVVGGSHGFVGLSAAGVVEEVNAASCLLLGYTRDELVGMSVRDLAHPDHVDDVETALAALATGPRRMYETTRVLLHRTGRPVHVRATVSFRPAGGERRAGFGVVLADLGARVAADTHRIAAEKQRRHVVDTATDAYVCIDEAGVVLEWNAAAQNLFGYPADVAIGQKLTALIVPPDLAAAHTHGLARLAAGGTPTLLGTSVELPATHQDGRTLQIELTPWSAQLDGGQQRFHAFCRDVAERNASRAALLEADRLLSREREHLRAAFEASPTADAVIDATQVLTDVNPALGRFLGTPVHTLVGRSFADVVYEADRPLAEAALTRVVRSGRPLHRTELRFIGEGQRVTWGMMSLVPLAGAATEDGVVLRIENLQTHKELEGALARQASYDEVSGLPNRSLFLERIRQAVTQQQPGQPAAVLVLELDGLRAVIDQEGFGGGDRVLAVIAQRFAHDTAEDITLAHLQPGRFGAVVPGGARDAAALAERLLVATRSPLPIDGRTVVLRASVGISVADEGGVEPASQVGRLVQDAEGAAVLARSEGGDRPVFAAPEMRRAQQLQDEMEQCIRDALVSDAVGVAYQPVFDLASGRLVSAEALLRVKNGAGQVIPPLDLVPAAEASGLIVDIGRRVLQIAARQAAQWRHDHGVIVPVAVNVSAVQLGRPGFPADVLDAVQKAGMPPEALSLELTESVLLEAGSAGINQLTALRDAGITLAIDDFGTGYASLSYLRELPATTLKIDRSFVAGIPDDHGAIAIVAGVIGLARNFGMTCIAEGIETDAQRTYLAERGILGQGYLLARPADGATISQLIARDGATTARTVDEPAEPDRRDDAGDRRDRAGDARDVAGDARDVAGDRRDLVGDRRDQTADRRDRAGDARDTAADQRDDAAEERDKAGARRDRSARQRDDEAERRESRSAADASSSAVEAPSETARPALARREAASDRDRAEQDREAGASERAQAGRDRQDAMTDRGEGATERRYAELDRTIAFADRGSGAGERLSAGTDRTTAHADRGSSARDREQSSFDELTGVYVRGAGLAELAREMARSGRQRTPLLLAFMDVDGLKLVNDVSGHAAGDELLRLVADSLRRSLRSYDLIMRYGGDEFVCVMAGLTRSAAAARMALVDATLAAATAGASAAVGLAEMRAADTPDTLIARADAAMYDGRRRRSS